MSPNALWCRFKCVMYDLNKALHTRDALLCSIVHTCWGMVNEGGAKPRGWWGPSGICAPCGWLSFADLDVVGDGDDGIGMEAYLLGLLGDAGLPAFAGGRAPGMAGAGAPFPNAGGPLAPNPSLGGTEGG